MCRFVILGHCFCDSGCYHWLVMTNCILNCETCGARKPFLLGEQELAEAQNKRPISKYCPSCRAATHWALAFLERRGGMDRRHSSERRTPEL